MLLLLFNQGLLLVSLATLPEAGVTPLVLGVPISLWVAVDELLGSVGDLQPAQLSEAIEKNWWGQRLRG